MEDRKWWLPAALFAALFCNCGVCLIPSPGKLAGETPRTLEQGEISVNVSSQEDNLSDPDFLLRHVVARAKVGLSPSTDIGVHYFSLQSEQTTPHRLAWHDSTIFGFGFSFKYSPITRQRMFAEQTVLSFGFHEHWSYLHLSFRSIFGFENKFIVPYLNFMVEGNAPVYVEQRSDGHFRQPQVTFNFAEFAGLKIPLVQHNPFLPSIYGEFGIQQMTFSETLFSNFYKAIAGGDMFWVHSQTWALGIEWTFNCKKAVTL